MEMIKQELLKNIFLIEQSSFTTFVDDPCSPLGYSSSFIFADETYYLNGTSAPNDCYKIILQLFNKSVHCSQPPCAFNGVYQPPLRGQFYAFSGYTYVTQFFNLPSNVSLLKMKSIADSWCIQNWTEINTQYGWTNNTFLPTYCFMINYVVALLNYGYGFSDNETSVTFVSYIDGVELAYAPGALMYELSLLGWGRPWYQSWPMWVIVIGSVIGIILIVAISYMIMSIIRAKREIVNPEEKVFLVTNSI